jgi:hypothetical protein
MHTSSDARVEPRAVKAHGSVGPGLVLYLLCGSLALYPLLEQFVAPVIAGAFALAASTVVVKLFGNGFRVPRSYVFRIWLTYALVYVVWYMIALLKDNPATYINQDSLGFLLYFSVLPILYLYVRFCRLEATFLRFIENTCIFVAVASVVLVATYYAAFGEVDGGSLLLTNAFVAGLGLTWHIDSNDGVLGLYTYTAHLLLLGIALASYRYALRGRKADIALIALYLVAIAFDGHRALVIAALLQLLLLAPKVFRGFSAAKSVGLVLVLIAALAAVALTNSDWIQQRFDFSSEDPSTAERHAQVPALLDKIAESPLFGSGFGAVAAYVRSDERPFSYEVDFLATAMKLGLIGSLIYFGTYLSALIEGLKSSGHFGFFLFAAGISFFFYMGTNGNQAMSTDSSVFHIFLFLLIAFSATPRKGHTPLPTI